MSVFAQKVYKNILVVRTDRIGDVVLTTPALKALRIAYPQAKISLLVSPLTKPLIEDNPYIDEVLTDDRAHEHAKLAGFLKLVKHIKKQRFDLAIIFHTKRRTNLLCFMAGIKNRLGYKDKNYGKLLTMPVKDERAKGAKHEVEYCLELIKTIGAEPEGLELYLTINEEAKKWADDLVKKNNISEQDRICLIHPGASDPSKMWSKEHFVQLINELKDRYLYKVIIVGSASIMPIADEIKSSVSSFVLDITGKTSIAELAALFQRADLIISNDSGPVHMASALHKPVISIFTRNQPGINPMRWKPLGDKSRHISVPEHPPLDFKKAGDKGNDLSSQIPVSAVLEEVDALYKLC